MKAGGAPLPPESLPRLAALAFAVALLGVSVWASIPLKPAILVPGVVLSAAVLGWAAGFPDPEVRGADAVRPRPGVLRLALAGSLVATLVLVAALSRFAQGDGVSRSGFLLYGLALAIAFAAFTVWPGAAVPRTTMRRGWEAFGLGAVLVAAMAFRLHRIESQPYGVWFDEAENTLVTLRILDEPGYRPVFVTEASQMPSLTFYAFAPFVKHFGRTALGPRLATTVVGLLAVVAVWSLTRLLFGPSAAILAAAFLAVSRWHVTFSRFGMAMIFPTLMIPLALFLYVRSQRNQSPRDAAWAGLSLGLGAQFYYSMVAIPGVLAASFLRDLAERSRRRWSSVLLFALVLIAALFAYAPLAQFARRHSQAFTERFRAASAVRAESLGQVAQILVSPSPEGAAARQVLWKNALRHAGMFHVRGDPNGRHNLPGVPMLDPVSGIFFGVGFLWALATVRDRRSLLLLLWFGASLIPGILSLDFEAPQAARTLGVAPAVAIFAAIPLARLYRALRGDAAGGFRPAAAFGVVLLVLGSSAGFAWNTFFGTQLEDPSAWASYSTRETRIGEVMRDEARATEFFASPSLVNTPPQRLLAGKDSDALPFLSGRDLPFETRGRRAVVFLSEDEDADGASRIQRIYPHASVEILRPRSGGVPILHVVRVPEADLDDLHGWTVTLRAPQGASTTFRTAASTWTWEVPDFVPPFRAEIRGRLGIETPGLYRFALSGSERARLRVDGGSPEPARADGQIRLDLARGIHDLVLEVEVGRRGGQTALTWAKPGETSAGPVPDRFVYSTRVPFGGLLGSYYAGEAWTGTPAFQRIDSTVYFYFHQLPLSRPFSVKWTGTLDVPRKGPYEFGLKSIDESMLTIGRREVVRHPGTIDNETTGSLALEAGPTPIEVRFSSRSNFTQIYLTWTPPGGERGPVPVDVLRPPAPRALSPDGSGRPP
jgi:hypothetical protein